MICEKCKEDGKTSKVFVGHKFSTLVAGEGAYYDEEGIYHSHNKNKVTTNFECSNGHKFSEINLPACPSCDYGSKKIVYEEEKEKPKSKPKKTVKKPFWKK